MDLLIDSFVSAIALVISLDKEMVDIVAVSLKVSCYSTLFASLLGIPIGFLVAFESFAGKHFLITCLNTLLAVPTVVIGLFVYAFISRRGVLGIFDLLYTQKAIIIGQTLLILPGRCCLYNRCYQQDRSALPQNGHDLRGQPLADRLRDIQRGTLWHRSCHDCRIRSGHIRSGYQHDAGRQYSGVYPDDDNRYGLGI